MSRRKPRILILDDDQHIRKTLTDILRLKGYEPFAAANGADAIAEARRAYFKLALIDLKLPDMSGLDAMARIKAISPLTEVIILTGYASLDSAIEATNKGAFSYLVKPYQVEDLLLHIRNGIDREQAQEEIQRLASHPRLSPNAVIDIELNGEVSYINPVAKRRFPEFAAAGFRHPLLEGLDIGLLEHAAGKCLVREVAIGDTIYEQQISFIPESRLIRIYAMDISARKQAEREKEEMQRVQDWRNRILDILEKLAKGASLASLLEDIALLVETKISDAKCSILLTDATGKHLVHGAAPHLPDFYCNAIDGLEIGPEVGSCGTAAHTKRLIIVEDIQRHPYWSRFRALAVRAGLRSCWSEPILSTAGKVLGTFALYHSSPRAPEGSDIELIRSLANLAGIAIERKQTEEAITVLATTDSLTGIANRREFGRVLDYEMSRAKRYPLPLSLIMFDIDHFKKVNDRFGHDKGDEILTTIAAIVTSNIRTSDIFARWGGEEFLILTPQTSIESAGNLAEKLRLAIADHAIDGPGNVTASFGVASFQLSDNAASFIKRADDLLYRAKASGRNRVETQPDADGDIPA